MRLISSLVDYLHLANSSNAFGIKLLQYRKEQLEADWKRDGSHDRSLEKYYRHVRSLFSLQHPVRAIALALERR